MAGRVPYGERYWQTPLKQTAPLGPQDVKFGSVPCVHIALGCVGVPTTLQPSAVHGLPSVQRVATPDVQAPCTQTSFAEHGFDAVGQGAPFATLATTQPLSGTQVEAVQGLESSQLGGGPPTQTPRMQESPVVHRLPSSHEAPVGRATCWQPSVVSQLSVVQEFLSSQLRGGPLTH